MRICHLIYSFNTGGAETMLVDIVNEQVKTNDVSLVIVNDSAEESLLNKVDRRVNIYRLNRKSGSRNPFNILKLNLKLWSLRLDVIHVHYPSLLALLLPCTSRVRFLTVHALHVPLEHARRANCLFAISNAVKEDILKRCPNIKAKVVFNGIKVNEISPRNKVEKRNIFRVVQVARLDSDKKGQDILIQALGILKRKGFNNIEVDLIGEGKSRTYLESLAIEEGVSDKVHFLGLRDREYIYAHLKDYDLMCHPARYEGFGLVVAEAMVARVPVLVPNDGGPFELIQSGKYGTSFRMGSVEDCVENLRTIMQNYSSVLEKVDSAYQYAIQNFSITHMDTKILHTYVSTLTK